MIEAEAQLNKIVVIRRMNSAATAWRPLLQVALAIWNINSRLRHRRIHTEELKQQLLPAFFYWIKNKSEQSWDLHNPSLPTQKKYIPTTKSESATCNVELDNSGKNHQKPIQQWTKPVIFSLPFTRKVSALALPHWFFFLQLRSLRRLAFLGGFFGWGFWVLKRFRQHSEFDDASD